MAALGLIGGIHCISDSESFMKAINTKISGLDRARSKHLGC